MTWHQAFESIEASNNNCKKLNTAAANYNNNKSFASNLWINP